MLFLSLSLSLCLLIIISISITSLDAFPFKHYSITTPTTSRSTNDISKMPMTHQSVQFFEDTFYLALHFFTLRYKFIPKMITARSQLPEVRNEMLFPSIIILHISIESYPSLALPLFYYILS